MALLSSPEERPLNVRSLHDPVATGYALVELQDQWVLQIETYGRSNRVYPDKPSQVIQIDADSAELLLPILAKLVQLAKAAE